MVSVGSSISKMQEAPNYILVDGGYYTHYRYYALMTWWKFSKSEEDSDEPFDNERFRTKFVETFHLNLQNIPSKLGVERRDCRLWMATDCPKTMNWRNGLIAEYKGTRKSVDGVRRAFELVNREQPLEPEYLLSADGLEADDCIAVAVEEIRKQQPEANIWVITSDMDYLQIASERTKLIDLKFKPLRAEHADPTKNLFCKIVAGDKSDNIPAVFARCGPKTAAKYYENMAEFERRLEQVEGAKARYERNRRLIDFIYIPKELTLELRHKVASMLY